MSDDAEYKIDIKNIPPADMSQFDKIMRAGRVSSCPNCNKAPLPLDRCVEILNENRHNFSYANVEDHHTLGWEIENLAGVGDPPDMGACLVRYITEYKNTPWSRDEDCYQYLTLFEARAICENYLREAK